jgi:hypothetical protein
MPSYAVQNKIIEIIGLHVNARASFTAQEVVDALMPAARIAYSYEHLRDVVHAAYFAGRMGIAYTRKAVGVRNADGVVNTAYVYHPKWINPTDYVSHEVRAKSSPSPATPPGYSTILDTAQTAVTTAYQFAKEVSDTWGDVLGDLIDGTFASESKDTVMVTPERAVDAKASSRGTYVPEVPLLYAVDSRGCICVDPSLTKVVGAAGDTVYVLVERKRISVVKNGQPRWADEAIHRVDRNGYLRLPTWVLKNAGLDVTRLHIETDEDTLYITSTKA